MSRCGCVFDDANGFVLKEVESDRNVPLWSILEWFNIANRQMCWTKKLLHRRPSRQETNEPSLWAPTQKTSRLRTASMKERAARVLRQRKPTETVGNRSNGRKNSRGEVRLPLPRPKKTPARVPAYTSRIITVPVPSLHDPRAIGSV